MTPQEKAIKLIHEYGYVIRKSEDEEGFFTNVNHAKECALIAVNELIKHELFWLEEVGGEMSESNWIKVKEELGKL